MNSRICDSVQDIRFRGAGMASPFTIVPMRTIVLAVLNLCISAAAFAQPGTCAGLSPGPLASLNGFVPFPSSNLWNTDISKAPVDPNSANLIDYIGASVTLHPDFGAGLYAGQTMGIPYQIEAGTQAKVPVKLTEYPGNSDPGPMSATTTPTAKRSTRPSSTARRSLPASVPSPTPASSAKRSSTTTTTSTATPASACTPQRHSTTAPPTRSERGGPRPSTPPTRPTRSGSAGDGPPHPNYPPSPGSTTPPSTTTHRRNPDNSSQRS